MSLLKELKQLHPEMTKWRRHIHQHPETAYEEVLTSEFVKTKLKEFGIPFVDGIGKTGVVGIIEGKQKGPKAIGLRADMDALPMQEMNTFDHHSKHSGKMHACGHDGHTTMLLGAAKQLMATRNFKGTVYLIFQPAEESNAGAKAMINDGLFKRFPMDEVYAVHNWPGDKMGTFKVKAGPVMAASDRFSLKIIGKGCHAALPQTGADSIVIASQIILSLQTIVSRNINPLDSAVVSISVINGGSTFNVIPEEVSIMGNIRTLSDDSRAFVLKRIEEISRGIAESMGAKIELKVISGYPVTKNSEKESLAALRAAEKVAGKENVFSNFALVSMGAEDFSFMLEEVPGCYVFIGNDGHTSGNPCLLHNPFYDFNDEILPYGSSYFVTLAEQQLPL